MKNYRRLSPYERDQLAVWKAEGVSNKECARRLGRSVSTIGRELKRNNWKGTHYVAIHAQGIADRREREKAHGKHQLKNPDVYEYVTDKLRGGWSPDQIAGKLRLAHPKDRYWWITAETIYRWIYQEEQMKCEVEEELAPGLIVFRGSYKDDGNIVPEVIYSPQQHPIIFGICYIEIFTIKDEGV